MSTTGENVSLPRFSPANADSHGRSRAIVAVSIAALALGGCSFFAGSGGPDSGPGPHVANCTLIQQATPSLYVCDGKTYTATQLYDLRNGKQASPCEDQGSQSVGSSAKPNPACNNAQHYF